MPFEPHKKEKQKKMKASSRSLMDNSTIQELRTWEIVFEKKNVLFGETELFFYSTILWGNN